MAAVKPPRIMYASIFDSPPAGVVISNNGSVDTVGFPYTNAYDWKPFTYWKPSLTSGTILYDQTAIAVGSQVTPDTLCVYGANLNSFSPTAFIQIGYGTGGAFLYLAPTYIGSTETCTYYKFVVPKSNQYIFSFGLGAAGAPQLAVIAAGNDFVMPAGCRVGFMPPTLARDTVVTNQTSQNGVFLGRSLTRKGSKLVLPMDFMSESFIRSTWLPFIKSAELRPFFMQWDTVNYPTENAICSLEASAQATFTAPNFMASKLQLRAWTE